MDFDGTKENIQPLRGGRNAEQLGMAVRAQDNTEFQQRLLQQKEEFEEAIRSYKGDDPLDNYYHYISWIEQNYPKNGHEGNVLALLEHCLEKFEDDKRYSNDRRFCKLWIKYIDVHPDPLELYHMMHAKELCIGCADLYKAWAYYHEASGNFNLAHQTFEMGRKQLAQPYDELETAHKNLVLAAGEHAIFGRNERQLAQLSEKRQALTSLHTYKPGRVGSLRVPSSSSSSSGSSTLVLPSSNPIAVYEDRGKSGGNSFRSDVAPTSIIAAAKRQVVSKENTLKPGPWTTVPAKKRIMSVKSLPFTVRADKEDEDDGGIRLPPDYPRETLEDYSNWNVNLIVTEQPDPKFRPMYPKDRVYIHPNTEYSIEELRSHRYLRKNSQMHTQPMEPPPPIMPPVFENADLLGAVHNPLIYKAEQPLQIRYHASLAEQQFNQLLSGGTFVQSQQPMQQCPQVPSPYSLPPQPLQQNPYSLPQPHPFHSNDQIVINNPPTRIPAIDIWNDSSVVENEKSFVYGESIQRQPKGTAMKTPIKTLNADDLVETGSRGGMDIAAMAQPADSAKPMPVFSDDSSSSFEDPKNVYGFNETCSTEMFNFNLNTMHVSTPQNKQMGLPSVVWGTNHEDLPKKQLFTEPKVPEKALSTIMEETKSYSSSSGSSSGAKSSILNTHTKQNMATISEEHNSYLAQNLKANAALRSSLLGEIMDFDNQQAIAPAPVCEIQSYSYQRVVPTPAVVTPLDRAPSDPFKPTVINNLLELVRFPGPHLQGYFNVVNVPKLMVKKEPFSLGNERYLVEKQLGKGTFGTVFKALDLQTNKHVALKHQKPANKWEFYICRELQARLADSSLQERFMDVSVGYFNDQASVLVSDFMPYGSLLDIVNLVKQKSGRTMKESLCIYFCTEMLRIITAMHSIKIIHADVKPDNFLAFLLPNNTIGLQLIDFGCSIDMTLFPPNAMFTRKVTTENFICCEMRDGRPWNYHTDLFCVAATASVLLFDKYIQIRKKNDTWSIGHRLPRYSRIDLWNSFFADLLNQKEGPADTRRLQETMNETLNTMMSDFMTEMRYLVNLLKNR